MPQVRFDYPGRSISVQRGMPHPKKIQDLWKGWYKEARKWLPQIPTIPQIGGNLPDSFGMLWRIAADPQVSLETIRFDIVNHIGERAYVLIYRKDSVISKT